jgi:hypothetical protein
MKAFASVIDAVRVDFVPAVDQDGKIYPVDFWVVKI